MSYNIISMKLSFLVLSRISFLSLKASVIILYGLLFVNTFFHIFWNYFVHHPICFFEQGVIS